MRITGFITINGSREWLDWTLTGDGIVEGPGLSAAEITYEGTITAPVEDEIAPTDGYEDLTVTELKVQLTQRELPIYGNKEQLISRLREWDVANPSGLEQTDVGEAEVAPEVGDGDDTVYLPEDEGEVEDGSESE